MAMNWKIEKHTSEDAWFEDYVAMVISSRTPEFPEPVQQIGTCAVEWQEIDPGVVRITASGGSIDDRCWAEGIVRDQLWHFGYHRAEVYFDHTAGFEDEIDKIPGVRRVTPVPNRAHSYQPGDRVVREYNSPLPASDEYPPEYHGMNSNAGTVEQANPDSTYHVRWDLGGDWQGWLNGQKSHPYYRPGELSPALPEHELWPEGHEALEHGLTDPKDPEDLDLLYPPERWSKTANWNDIMAKAKRLIQSGQVQVLRNGYNNIVGHIIGDHGEYNTEISRDDPNSRAITGWQCECPWDQYAWQRTRQWKKYEGRPCAHTLALYWKSLSTPLDGDMPSGAPATPGERGPLPGGPPSAPMGPAPMADATVGPPQSSPAPALPGMDAMQPGSPDVLPTAPMDQLAMQMNPPMPGSTSPGMPAPPGSVSVPGARPPSPFGPVQYPGGTYSKTAAEEFLNGERVRLNKPTYGLTEGREGATDAGQYIEIPANKMGEVMGQDPSTGWVEVIFPLSGGEMTSYHARCFLEPSEITKIPGSTPFIKRAPSS